MKISLFFNYSFYCNYILNDLLANLGEHQIDRVYLSGGEWKDGIVKAKKREKWETVEEIKVLKTVEQKLTLDTLVPLTSDKNTPGTFLSFDELSKKYGFPITLAESPNKAEVIELMKQDQSDVFFVSRYTGLFREESLQVPQIGILNLHTSILPKYKGVENVLQAIIRKDEEYGCTLHWILDPYPKIDNGPIIEHFKRQPDFDKSLLWNCFQLYVPVAGMLLRTLEGIKANKITKDLPEQENTGTYFSVPTQEDVDRLKEMDMPIFDVNELHQLLQQYYDPTIEPSIISSHIQQYAELDAYLKNIMITE